MQNKKFIKKSYSQKVVRRPHSKRDKFSQLSMKGLIFDLDGTLTLTQHFHYLAFRQVFKKYGVKYMKKDDYQYAGKGSHCIFPEVFEKHGKKITKNQIETYAEEKKQIYTELIQKSDIELVPGIEKFLKLMKKIGFSMAVASGNKLESVEYILKKTGIRQYFQAIITNKDVKKSKPAPDIFLKAAEKLKLKNSECIVFEDAVNGIVAAQKAKMLSVGLTTGFTKKALREAGATFVVKDYNELRADPDFGVRLFIGRGF